MRKRLALFGIFITFVILLLIFLRLDLHGVINHVRRLGCRNWLIGVVIYLCAFLPRGLRWKLMLPDSGRLPCTWIMKAVVIGYAANNLLPFRLGELVRSYLVGERFALSKLDCLATIVTEKLLDGCCLLVMLAICLPLIQLRGTAAMVLHRMVVLVLLVFIIVVASCIGLGFWNRQAASLAERFCSPLIIRLVRMAVSATAILRDRKILLSVAGLTALVWLLEGSCFVFFLATMGIRDPWPSGIFCLVIVNLSILIPSAPGYVGVFQAGSVAAFLAVGQNASLGLAIGTAIHLAQFLPTILIGGALALTIGLKWKRVYHLKDE